MSKTDALIESFISPLEEARDPAVVAHDLVRNSRGLLKEITQHHRNVEKALKSANSQLDGLKKVGSDKISAPAVLAGDPLRALKGMQSFVNDVVKQIEQLKKG